MEIKLDFEVLGKKVTFKDNNESDQISAHEIIKLVNHEANKIKDVHPSLEDSQKAVLVSLKLAKDLLSLGKEYHANINELQSNAYTALAVLNEIAPKADS